MLVKNMTKAIGAAILSSRALQPGPMPTLDPFLFCVYHRDQYPPGNAAMEAPVKGNGQDFSVTADYRMYHGEKIPGFPQHPHRKSLNQQPNRRIPNLPSTHSRSLSSLTLQVGSR
jgi:hypothetical protein